MSQPEKRWFPQMGKAFEIGLVIVGSVLLLLAVGIVGMFYLLTKV